MSDTKPNGPGKTCAGQTGTFTTAGFVPHLPVPIEGGSFLAPVKLETHGNRRGWNSIVHGARHDLAVPAPLKRGGKYVYALPGGAEIAA